MNMVNTVVNGYITVIVLILFLVFYSPLAGGIALVGILLSALFLYLLEARSQPKRHPSKSKAQDEMVEVVKNSLELSVFVTFHFFFRFSLLYSHAEMLGI